MRKIVKIFALCHGLNRRQFENYGDGVATVSAVHTNTVILSPQSNIILRSALRNVAIDV